MKTSAVLVVLLLTIAGGLQFSSPVAAYDYALESVPVYQLDVPDDQDPDTFSCTADWFLTTSVAEMSQAVSNGWDSRGIGFYVSPAQIPGTLALYRLYYPDSSDHLYTTSWAERQSAIATGFSPEGALGYVFPADASVPGTVPLHRFYSDDPCSLHMYFTDATAGAGAAYEGVACYVWPAKQQIANLTITAPTAGEELKGLTAYDVSWKSSMPGGYISLSYSSDAGNSWTLIDCGLENKGFTKWRVPDTATTHARIQIVWTDAIFGQTNVLARAESQSDFKIKKRSRNGHCPVD